MHSTEEQAVANERHAWLKAEVEPITPGIHRIVLPLESTALRGVNVYVVDTTDGPLLVDAGWARPETERMLEDRLSDLGLKPADLARIIVTHSHHDHYTQAVALNAKYGTPVSLGRSEAPSISAYSLPLPHTARPSRLRRCGAAKLAGAFEEIDTEHARADGASWGPPQHWCDDGDTIALGDRVLEVVETPGHTRGHIVLRDDTLGFLFAGDHILPHITPSIGYDAALTRYPLQDYLQSLRLVRNRRDLTLLPAHGPTGVGTHRRIDELLDHHRRRLDEVRARVATGDRTPFDVAQAVRWTRRELTFADIGNVENQALAVLEIEAHLDVLALDGQVSEVTDFDNSGVRTFVSAA